MQHSYSVRQDNTKSRPASLRESVRVNRIAVLQRTLGNQVVQQLFRARLLLPKLTISDPGDIYEQEADRIADEVVRSPEPSGRGQRLSAAQRKSDCPACRQELDRQLQEPKDELVQPKSSNPEGSRAIYPEIEGAIRTLPSRGRPLPESDRAFMEPRFRADFSAVRIHTDGHANDLARAVNAQAFTVGRDVVFGAGRYAPGTEPGRRLLAHELTHVVQQTTLPGMLSAAQCSLVEDYTSSSVPLSRSGEAAGIEAANPAKRMVAGLSANVQQNKIARQPASSSPETTEAAPDAIPSTIPGPILTIIDEMMERSTEHPDEDNLRRLGQIALRTMDPKEIAATARRAGVPGAQQRERELEDQSDGTIQRQAAEAAAATAGTMWWLTLVDGPLPIGDIVFGALILAAALAASQGIGKGPCYSRRNCEGRIYGHRVKHCHNCRNYFSGRSIRHPTGICENC